MKFSKIILPLFIIIFVSGCQPKSDHKPDGTNSKIEQPDSLDITDGWVRPAATGQNSAAYLQIFNGTTGPDTLEAVESDVAEKAGIHESFEENGMAGMRAAGPQVIPPDSLLKLQPGGLHIMLMNIKKQLAEGDSVTILLHFSVAGNKRILLPIKLSSARE